MGVRSTGSQHPTTTEADGHLLEYFRQTFGAGGGGTNTSPANGHSATGGVISDYTDSGVIYRSHTFTSAGTFNVDQVGSLQNDVEVVLIAGGGGGGLDAGGGGGAGAFYPNPSVPISASPGSYTITIGAGGLGSDVTDVQGSDGGNTVAFGYTVKGGGGGGSGTSGSTRNGRNSSDPFGGSGGGGRRGNTAGTGGTYGNDGYAGSEPLGGGGGGGAGGAAPSSPSFQGGAGISNSIETGSAIIYAAGGTGGNEVNPSGQNAGVPGGGGLGGSKGQVYPGKGGNGTSGLGAGGGGGGGSPGPNGGGNGGSGRVIIRYKLGAVQSPGVSPKGATGGAISIYNSKVIHTFLNTATFTTPASFSETVEYVVVGGGGGGGAEENSTGSGGGGAGAFRTGTAPIGNSQNFTVQIGAGGKGGNIRGGANPNSALDGIVGTASFFGPPITAPGGGFGAGQITSGGPGGSGGGGKQGGAGGPATGGSFPGTIGPSPTSGWGQGGGSGISSPPISGGGGGGGAGASGVNGTSSKAGFGGAGIQVPTTFRDPAQSFGAPGPTSNWITGGDNSGKYWFAGGGGGGASGNSPSAIGKGGAYNGSSEIPGGPWSGAGDGVSGNVNNGENALTNTGSGGGGAGAVSHGATPGSTEGGQGGSGIVLIAYPE